MSINLRWSILLSKTVPAYSSRKKDSVEIRIAENAFLESFNDLLSPLSSFPPLPIVTSEVDKDEENLLFSELGDFYGITSQDCQKLLKYSGSEQQTQLNNFLTAVHGSISFSSAPKKKFSEAISLMFNERRALLTTLLKLFEQDELFEGIKRDLLEQGLVAQLCERGLDINEKLNRLLSTARGAFEPQVQIACLIWERRELFRIALIATDFGAESLSMKDVEGLLKVYHDLSNLRDGAILDAFLLPQHQQQNSSITNFFGRNIDLGVIEKSHFIDILIFSLFSLAIALENTSFIPESDWIEAIENLYGFIPPKEDEREIWRAESTVSQQELHHAGYRGVVEMIWGSFKIKCIQRENERVSEEMLRPYLKLAFKLRALQFLRTLTRSREFRYEKLTNSILLHAMNDLLSPLVEWVARKNARKSNIGIEGTDYELEDEDEDADINILLVSRIDERSTSSLDFLEDLMELLIVVATVKSSDSIEYARRFFIRDAVQCIFLQHCWRVAEKSVFYNLVTALIVCGGCDEISQLTLGFLDRKVFEDARESIKKFRDGMIKTRDREFCIQLRTIQAIIENSSENYKYQFLHQYFEDLEFCQSCFSLVTNPLLANELHLKASVLRLLSSFCFPSSPVLGVIVENWRNYFQFPRDSTPLVENRQQNHPQMVITPKFDVWGQMLQKEAMNHKFPLTNSFLEFSRAILLSKGSVDVKSLLQFIVEDVFDRFDTRNYSHPGEKWIICANSLKIFLAAVENNGSNPDYRFWIMDYFLRDRTFEKLLAILRSIGLKHAAPGLEECYLVSRRWPYLETQKSSSHRLDWLLATKKEQSTKLIPHQQNSTGTVPFGLLFAGSGGKVEDQSASVQKIVQEWLNTATLETVDEHPYLWDDGDAECVHRFACAQFVLRLIVEFIRFQNDFNKWNPSQTTRIDSLILGNSQLNIDTIASYVGFSLDSKCREYALEILDHVASNRGDLDNKLFPWIKSSYFYYSMKNGSTEERRRVFHFLCKYRPKMILKDSVNVIVAIIDDGDLKLMGTADALRTLGFLASVGQLPVSLTSYPEITLKRYMDYLNLNDACEEALLGLSWTMRMLPNPAKFLFKRENGPTTICESILSVFLRARNQFPIASTNLIESWRILVESNLPLIDFPLNLVGRCLEAVISNDTSFVQMNIELTKISLVLLYYHLNTGSSPLAEEEVVGLSMLSADALLNLGYSKNPEAYSFATSILTLTMRSEYKNVLSDTLSSRIESLLDSFSVACTDSDTPPMLRSAAGTAFSVLVPFSLHLTFWIDSAMRKGTFQGIIASTVDRLYDSKSSILDDLSFEPVLFSLQSIAKYKQGARVIVDNLTRLTSQPLIFGNDTGFQIKVKDIISSVGQLVLALSRHFPGFATRFMKVQKQLVLTCLVEENENGLMFVSMLAICASSKTKFEYEFKDDNDYLKAVISLMCTNLKGNRIIRACITCLLNMNKDGIGFRQVEEISALVQLSSSLYLDTQRSDLEKTLCLLYLRLKSNNDKGLILTTLKTLFPKLLAGSNIPSVLEEIAESEKKSNGYISVICTKLQELRFK